MSYWPEEGGAWGCKINAHRALWNGTICADPCNWDCGARSGFRESYCDRGDTSCFQLNAYSSYDPNFIVDEKGLKWLIEEDRHALDDQVLVTYTHESREPGGVLGSGKFVVAGIYIVDRVEIIEKSHRSLYQVFPKQEGTMQLADLRVPTQRFTSLGRPYLMHFDATAVRRMRDQLSEAARRQSGKIGDPRGRWLDDLDRHLERATRANGSRREKEGQKYVEHTGSFSSPFAEKLKDFTPAPEPPRRPARVQKAVAVAEPVVVAPVAPPEPAPAVERPSLTPMFDLVALRRLGKQYGEDVVRALWLAGRRPNAMILLRGAPGIGKSRLALDVTPSERRAIIAVPSTWRGREDLLGYASPISGEFQPTAFTELLRRAATAWQAGDREPFVVIFEEFNLSPPEFWFSEILVRSQYSSDAGADRSIALGGKPPADWETQGPASVWLSPAVRFIATINSDHTTRDLSPRVLDRVTLIQVEMQPDAMFSSIGLDIEKDQLQAIKDLHHRLESRGAVFSMRTARAMESAFETTEQLGASHWELIDLILVTQVLSKVRLHVGEPGDHEIVVDLAENWAETWGANLPLCAGRFERWRESLESGFDIVQA